MKFDELESLRRARNTPGLAQPDALPQIDVKRMRAYRLGRVQEQLRHLDLAGIILYDPINIRYATGSSNMQVWFTHDAIRYCWVPAEGRAVLFDYAKTMHLYDHLDTIREVRPAISYGCMSAPEQVGERARAWTDDIDEVISEDGADKRVAADRLHFEAARELESLGYELHGGTRVTDLARAVKSSDEIDAMLV